jgi:sRNA-binding carbon storage regulator CsrA
MEAMLILSRVQGEAIVIGGDVRVEVAKIHTPSVRLRVSRLNQGESPSDIVPDCDGEVAGNISDFTLVKNEGQSFGINRTTVSVEQVTDNRVTLAIEPPGGVNVFGEEVWDALCKSEGAVRDDEASSE